MKTYELIDCHEKNPEYGGAYYTSKGTLHWFKSETIWRCRQYRISEEHPEWWLKQVLEPLVLSSPPIEKQDERSDNIWICPSDGCYEINGHKMHITKGMEYGFYNPPVIIESKQEPLNKEFTDVLNDMTFKAGKKPFKKDRGQEQQPLDNWDEVIMKFAESVSAGENYKDFEILTFVNWLKSNYPLPKQEPKEFEMWLEKETSERETEVEKCLNNGTPTQVGRIQLYIFRECLSEYKRLSNYPLPSKQEVVCPTDDYKRILVVMNFALERFEGIAGYGNPNDATAMDGLTNIKHLCESRIKHGVWQNLPLPSNKLGEGTEWINEWREALKSKTKVILEATYYPEDGFYINGRILYPEKYAISPSEGIDKK